MLWRWWKCGILDCQSPKFSCSTRAVCHLWCSQAWARRHISLDLSKSKDWWRDKSCLVWRILWNSRYCTSVCWCHFAEKSEGFVSYVQGFNTLVVNFIRDAVQTNFRFRNWKTSWSLLCLGCVAHWTAEGDIEAVIDDRVHVLDCYLFVISNEVVHELWRDRVFLGTHRWLRGQSWCTSRQQQWNNRAWYSKSHINTSEIQRQTTMNRPSKTPSWFEDLLSLSTTTELHTFLEVWASFALPPIPIILLCTFTCASRMLYMNAWIDWFTLPRPACAEPEAVCGAN